MWNHDAMRVTPSLRSLSQNTFQEEEIDTCRAVAGRHTKKPPGISDMGRWCCVFPDDL